MSFFVLIIYCALGECRAVSDPGSPFATEAACTDRVAVLMPEALVTARIIAQHIGARVHVRGWCGSLDDARRIAPASCPGHQLEQEA